MSVRPPKALAAKPAGENPLAAALEHEVLAEKAATYARLVKRLEEALAALREFAATRSGPAAPGDGGTPGDGDAAPSGVSRGRRGAPAGRSGALEGRHELGHGEELYQSLLDAAGEALWHVMIQRELCGLRRHEAFLAEYAVPATVRLRMGRARQR